MTDNITRLDATGLRCPLPVLRAGKALKGIVGGKMLEILATDEAAPADFEAFCQETGHTLVNIERVGDIYRIRINKVVSGR